MRILNVSITLDSRVGGGTAERTYQLTRSLLERGINCDVLILDISDIGINLDGIEKANIIALACINKRYYIPVVPLRKIIALVQQADVIHLISHWTLLNVVVYYVAKIYKKPYVICSAGALAYFGRSKIIKKIYNKLIGRRILRDAVYCIAISRNEITDFRGYGIENSKIVLIPNGINEEENLKYDSDNFRFRYGLSQKKIILFVGRLNPIKGIDLLFNAFCNIYNQIPDYQLVIAGPDEGMLHDLERRVQELKLTERIKFIGYLNTELKSSAYYASSLLVIPSRKEAMSIVVLEAGVIGTPVLITENCGFNEIETIRGGKVVEASVCGLEHGLIELLRENNELKEMGMNLKNHVQNNYLWENITNEYLRVFNDTIKCSSHD